LAADVISVARTNENFWLLYDSKGWFTLHHINLEEAKVLTLLLFCSFFSHTYADVLIAVISFNCDWLYMFLTLSSLFQCSRTTSNRLSCLLALQYKLCKLCSAQFGEKGVPHITTFDGRTIR
jgi:hypothetical protein